MGGASNRGRGGVPPGYPAGNAHNNAWQMPPPQKLLEIIILLLVLFSSFERDEKLGSRGTGGGVQTTTPSTTATPSRVESRLPQPQPASVTVDQEGHVQELFGTVEEELSLSSIVQDGRWKRLATASALNAWTTLARLSWLRLALHAILLFYGSFVVRPRWMGIVVLGFTSFTLMRSGP
jgi:hypothetical protein